ncbi:MAG: NUDIX domain-containing protein [Candidatus Sericytochromatia bacterium]
MKKAYAYIIKNNKLLVFSEPEFPEVGFQVAGGTVEENEDLEVAIKREVIEETGLTDFSIKKYLGKQVITFNQKTYERHFFLIELTQDTPETWEHIEKFPSEGEKKEILFRFCWKDLAKDNIDIGNQGVFLYHLQHFLD